MQQTLASVLDFVSQVRARTGHHLHVIFKDLFHCQLNDVRRNTWGRDDVYQMDRSAVRAGEEMMGVPPVRPGTRRFDIAKPRHTSSCIRCIRAVKLGLRHPRLNRLIVADTFNAEQLSHLFFFGCDLIAKPAELKYWILSGSFTKNTPTTRQFAHKALCDCDRKILIYLAYYRGVNAIRRCGLSVLGMASFFSFSDFFLFAVKERWKRKRRARRLTVT